MRDQAGGGNCRADYVVRTSEECNFVRPGGCSRVRFRRSSNGQDAIFGCAGRLPGALQPGVSGLVLRHTSIASQADRRQATRSPAPTISSSRYSAAASSRESGIAGPAHGNLCTVAQNGEPCVLGVRFHTGYPFHVDEKRAVNAQKAAGIERRFQTGNRLLLEPGFAFAAEFDVIETFRLRAR